MKFATAYYLVLIYATVILKPIIPVVQDALVHCFAEAYHIATVHAIKGNNHLEKELAGSGADADSNKTQKADKAEQAIHETAIDFAYDFLYPNFLKNHHSFSNELLSNVFIDFVNPPPRIVV